MFNKKKFQFACSEVEALGFDITQDGIEPIKGYLTALMNYPIPKRLKDMRGFSGFLNQSAFMTKSNKKNAMSKLRHRLQSTHEWDWTDKDSRNYIKCKKWAVKECKVGVKRLVREDQVAPNTMVLVSDWSTDGTGYIAYQVLCECIKANEPVEKINCCVEKWRIINCGATFNSPAELRFSLVEGELLGIAKALHKARYYISGHTHCHRPQTTGKLPRKHRNKRDREQTITLPQKEM